MATLEELEAKVDKLEQDLSRARRKAEGYNSGKYKGGPNATPSRLFVDSLEKDLAETLDKIRELKG